MKGLKKWLKRDESDQGLNGKDKPEAVGVESTSSAHTGRGPFRFGLAEPVYEDDDPQIDIVAIHGLNGDRIATWSEGNIFWLRDLLPTTLKQKSITARIWSYGYNADAHSGTAVSAENLWDHGESFLGQLVNRRSLTNSEDRPIIFIVHSLGGLILKSALVMSNASNPNHLARNKALKLSTHGVIFCGVPHQGANNIPEAKILLNIGSVVTNTTTNIVRILEPGNEVLRTQRDSFTYISNDFFIVNLVETENTPSKVGSRLIVPRDSAVLPGSTGRKYWAPIGVNGKNHITLVKFSSLRDSGYQILADQILLMVKEGYRDVNNNWESWRRSLKGKDFTGARLRPRLPHAPSPRFCGRNHEFEMLDMFIEEEKEEVQNVIAIYGAGGIGKTETILQYVYSHQKDYMSVVWINAASRSSAEMGFIQAMQDLVFVERKNAPSGQANFGNIASDLGIVGLVDDNGVLTLPEENEGAVRQVIEGLKGWLAQYVNVPWLLVFDNHDDMSFSLRDFFPTCSWGSIMITSRRPAIKSYATMHHYYELEGLDETSAVKLLLSISGRDSIDDQAGARRVVEKLDYFPLAIDQAAAYISLRPHMTFDTYLERYDTKAKELLSLNEHPWPDYKKTCMTTWEMSREAIREESRPAAVLLAVCSFFNNDDIWGEYLRRSMYFEGKLLSGKDIDDLIALLYSYSMIKPKLTADTFSIHGVVHLWGRERLSGDDILFIPVGAARMMKDAVLFVHAQRDIRGLAEYNFERRLLPHLEYFLDASQAVFGVEQLKMAAQLRFSIDTSEYKSIQTGQVQMHTSSRTFRDRYLELLEITGSIDYLVGRTLPNEEVSPSPLLTRRYFRDLNAEKDTLYAQRVMDIQEVAGNSMVILAKALSRQGRSRRAARLELSLIYFYLGILDNDIAPLLTHIANFAVNVRDTAIYQEAEKLLRFALAKWPRTHPDTHTVLPRIQNNLAVTLSRMGKYQEAEALQSQISPSVSGDSAAFSMDVINRMSDRVVNLIRQENYAEASKLGKAVLALRETNLPPGHPDICLSLNNLALALEKQNLLAEAELMSKRALEGRQALFSSGHIAILRSKVNLAAIFRKQDKYDEAAKLYEDALDDYLHYHGDHEETILTRKNLAVLWADQKKYKEACNALSACAKQLAVKLGIEHRFTLGAINDWARCLVELKQLRGATNLFWYVLQVRLRILTIDKAMDAAFLGLTAVRMEYARIGKTRIVQWLDDTVPKHEAQMMARLRQKQLKDSEKKEGAKSMEGGV